VKRHPKRGRRTYPVQETEPEKKKTRETRKSRLKKDSKTREKHMSNLGPEPDGGGLAGEGEKRNLFQSEWEPSIFLGTNTKERGKEFFSDGRRREASPESVGGKKTLPIWLKGAGLPGKVKGRCFRPASVWRDGA